ncbi:MAG: DHH family phosphoesterase [Desulfovibrionaceae bacterium]|jgi:nanoRNase/pAp phosphatase (c-di-AMP/oligoRNAs hydrolase)|nr:DHH family phosphoesterase [Desulfovibrionaceae bacterium]
MAYFRKLGTKLDTLLELLSRDERWLILINADPDAMASAMALRRIMANRVQSSEIARVNEITRPDNLAMIRYLGIPMRKLSNNLLVQFDRFALVDSQPHHHAGFKDVSFSLVLDHHPVSQDEHPVLADFKDLKPEYGACSTLLTEYLYNLKIRPGKLLATALTFGIRSDTAAFTRNFCDVDVRAFRYLSKFNEGPLLHKITASEFKLEWLGYFTKAFMNMRLIGRGIFSFIDSVENPDILVILADFFMRVHEVAWTAMAGVHRGTLVVILRGDGMTRDMGRMAGRLLGGGTGGGHKAMARAEIPVDALSGKDPYDFVLKRIQRTVRKKRPKPAPETAEAVKTAEAAKATEGTRAAESPAPKTADPAAPAASDPKPETA